MFVVDDLVAWLLGVLADSGRKGLATLVFGSRLEIALRSAAEEALRLTAIDMNQGNGADAAQMAMVLGQVFRSPTASAALAGHGTLLEGLHSAIATQLTVLDDSSLTGIGQSSSELLGVTSAVLADSLTAHLVREIVERGVSGPLFPLATQLNHDVTHLQGRQLWEHPETLIVCSDLASWTGKAGDPVAARNHYAQLRPIHERVWGPNSPRTLAARANLAFYTGEAGDPAAGRDQYAALIPDLERVLGVKHPETIGCQADLARWTGEAGDPGGARDQYAALIPDLERVLGPNHPDTQAGSRARIRWNQEVSKPK